MTTTPDVVVNYLEALADDNYVRDPVSESLADENAARTSESKESNRGSH